MKKQIREKVFESNSSAQHTLYIKGELGKNELTMSKEGYVLADFGQFGKEYNIYTSQDDKLSYLLTELYYINSWEEDRIKEMYQFKYIEEAIMDYDNTVKGIKILGKVNPEIDHQEIPEYGESHFVNYWDKNSIQNFLFNNNIGIKTDCD